MPRGIDSTCKCNTILYTTILLLLYYTILLYILYSVLYIILYTCPDSSSLQWFFLLIFLCIFFCTNFLVFFKLFAKAQVSKKKKKEESLRGAEISGKHSDTEQLFTAYFFDACKFFSQTLPVVTGPRRSLLHNTMLLSLGEASVCQLHSKTRSSYLNLLFLDNVLEQNIHISLAGFSRGVKLAFYSH